MNTNTINHADLTTMSESVNNMSQRALGVLNLLGGQFSGEEVSKVNDEAVFWTLESISKEILDIQRTVELFHESNRLQCQSEAL
jgi:hypothetical protein